MHVSARLALLGPVNDELQRVIETQRRMPIKAAACLGYIELQVVGFVRMRTGVKLPPRALAPHRSHLLDDPANGLGVFVVGSEVPALGIAGAVLKKAFGQHEIAAQGLQHMLPGAYGVGVADIYAFALFEGREDVRN